MVVFALILPAEDVSRIEQEGILVTLDGYELRGSERGDTGTAYFFRGETFPPTRLAASKYPRGSVQAVIPGARIIWPRYSRRKTN